MFDILGVCVKMLGELIDEFKRDILVFMRKTRYARVDVSDSEDDESNYDSDSDSDYEAGN